MLIDAVGLARMSPNDLTDVEAIFDDLSGYSMRVDGLPRREGAAYEFATALPGGYAPENKYSFLAKRGNFPIGLLDIIQDYPFKGTVFIGLLAVRESMQGAGVGRKLFEQAERFVHDDLDARIIRLAVVEANPVIGFWRKMGFQSTGEVKPYEGHAVHSRAILMEKVLSSS